MAIPEPANVSPWYLRNITQALALDETTGNVYVRTDADISIGNANITVGNVGITSFGNIPISGNTLPVTIDNANIEVTQGTSPWVVTGNVASTITGTNLDAFGRLRVSNPVTLFDSQNRYIDGQQFSTTTAGSGTRTYVQNESSFNLTVGTGATDAVYTQSKTVQAYQPGKSLLTMNTFAMAAAASMVQRVGYFTTNDGIYFEQNAAGDLYLVIRSNTSGAPVEERILQANWNTDTLAGTGGSPNPSGIELDPTLVQIFWCDVEWLGVGNVRAGFVINGQFIVCHVFEHANIPGNTKVYMSTASLNPRYEIYKTGAGGGGTMKQICSTVISEGGYNPATTINYVTNGTSTTRVSSANTLTSLCSIRLNPAYPDAVVVPAQVDLLLIDVRYGQFQLVENATIANATFANISGSVVQSSIHTDTITDGNVVYQGLTSSRDAVVLSDDIKKRLQLWRYANGTPSTLTLAVSYTGTNTDLLYKMGWEELTN